MFLNSIFNIDAVELLDLGCYFKMNFYSKLILYTLVPLAIMGCMFLFHLFKQALAFGDPYRRRHNLQTDVERFLLLTYVLFSSVSTKIFSTFNCVSYGDDSKFYLYDDSSIEW